MQKLSALFSVMLMLAILFPALAQDDIVAFGPETDQGLISGSIGSNINFDNGLNEINSTDQFNLNKTNLRVQDETITTAQLTTLPGYEKGRFRIAMQGGYGYRTASTKEARQNMINKGFSANVAKTYYRNLKQGIQGGGQIHYMFWEQHGLGIDYNFSYSKTSAFGNMDPGDGFTRIYGSMSEDIYVQFAGVSWYAHQWVLPARLKFYSLLSVGLAMYRNETRIIYSSVLLTANAMGTNLETGLEYFFSKRIAAGLGLSYFQSTLSKVTVNNGNSIQEVKLEKEQFEGLARLNFSTGIRIYF